MRRDYETTKVDRESLNPLKQVNGSNLSTSKSGWTNNRGRLNPLKQVNGSNKRNQRDGCGLLKEVLIP